jgi:muconolactone delta-isomerase
MLFHVRMDVHIPHDLDPATRAEFVAQEKNYCQKLQRQGKWLRIWRIVGEDAIFSILGVANLVRFRHVTRISPARVQSDGRLQKILARYLQRHRQVLARYLSLYRRDSHRRVTMGTSALPNVSWPRHSTSAARYHMVCSRDVRRDNNASRTAVAYCTSQIRCGCR